MMKKAILATKVGMTQIFDENGILTPVRRHLPRDEGREDPSD